MVYCVIRVTHLRCVLFFFSSLLPFMCVRFFTSRCRRLTRPTVCRCGVAVVAAPDAGLIREHMLFLFLWLFFCVTCLLFKCNGIMSRPLTEEHIVSAHQQAPNVRTATSIRVNPPSTPLKRKNQGQHERSRKSVPCFSGFSSSLHW